MAGDLAAGAFAPRGCDLPDAESLPLAGKRELNRPVFCAPAGFGVGWPGFCVRQPVLAWVCVFYVGLGLRGAWRGGQSGAEREMGKKNKK